MDTINVTTDATVTEPVVQPEVTPDAVPPTEVKTEVTEPVVEVKVPTQFNPLNVKDLRTLTDYTVTEGTLKGTVVPEGTQVFATEVSLDGTWYRGFAVPIGLVAFPKSIFPVVVRAMSIRDERALIKDIRLHIEQSDAFVNYVQTVDALGLTATTPALLAFIKKFAGLLTTLTTDIEKESDALKLRFLWIYLSQVSNDLGGTLASAKKLNPTIFGAVPATPKVESVVTEPAVVNPESTNEVASVNTDATTEPANVDTDVTTEPAVVNTDVTTELTPDEKLLTIDEIPVNGKQTRSGGRRK